MKKDRHITFQKSNVIILICILFFLYTCTYTEMTHMDEKDKSYLSTYNLNDTILFESIINQQTDTMIIIEKTIYNSLWPFLRDESSTEYHAGGYIDYIIKHGNTNLDGSFCITKQEKKKPVSVTLTLGNRFCFDVFKNADTVFRDITCDDVKFQECVLIDDTNSHYGKIVTVDSIKQFVWSKENGLVFYEFSNGDKFYVMKWKNGKTKR